MDKIEEIVENIHREKIFLKYHDIIHQLTGVAIDFTSADGKNQKL